MKLKGLLNQIFELGSKMVKLSSGKVIDNILTGDNLANSMYILKQCDEFKNVKDFQQMFNPIMVDQSNIIVSADTMKLSDDTPFEFNDILYLYSISLMPEMYDQKTWYEPVKDSIGISPTSYNPIDLSPTKRITIEFSPERKQDIHDIGDERAKKEIREKLEKVLENPKEYQVKGVRGILIRGIWKNVGDNKNIQFPLSDKVKHD
ncbi:hypothetical protein M0P65_07715 [Candidatus Gracilibacteria bacterium]|jgi:hypothetical protein|nr:hypothetical protein [Candidatus Gracilibacteria bacterium]